MNGFLSLFLRASLEKGEWMPAITAIDNILKSNSNSNNNNISNNNIIPNKDIETLTHALVNAGKYDLVNTLKECVKNKKILLSHTSGDEGSTANIYNNNNEAINGVSNTTISYFNNNEKNSTGNNSNKIESSANISKDNKQEHPLKISTRSNSKPTSVVHQALHNMLFLKKARDDWVKAIFLFQTLNNTLISNNNNNNNNNNISCLSLQRLLPLLARQGRWEESFILLSQYFTYINSDNNDNLNQNSANDDDSLKPTRNLIKCIAETAFTLQSVSMCEYILHYNIINSIKNNNNNNNNNNMDYLLTPSSAIPLILTLDKNNKWQVVLEWWDNALPKIDINTNNSYYYYSQAERIRSHLKLCSYVSICAARRGLWLRALEAFEYVEKKKFCNYSDGTERNGAYNVEEISGNKDRIKRKKDELHIIYNKHNILLHELKALRVAKAWGPALTIFTENLSDIKNDRNNGNKVDNLFIADIIRVLTRERAEQWIPKEVVKKIKKNLYL